jgi:hypothetical protein
MTRTLTTYNVEPLRSGLSDDRRVRYADDRLPKLLDTASRPADVLGALLFTYPPTTN